MGESIDPKQKLLVEYLSSNREIFLKTYTILKPKYFDEPLNHVISFLKEYFNKYNNVPNNDILITETSVEIKERKVDPEDFDYIVDELETFCQQNAMRIAILDSVDDIEKENYEAIDKRVREAMMVKLDQSLGLNVFDNPAVRLYQMQENIASRSLGYPKIDELIGNIKRGELGIFSAGTSGGKSIMLANVANNLAKDGLDVLVVSLEMNEDMYAQRFDTIITGIPIKEVFDHIEDIEKDYEQKQDQYGSIVVKRSKTGTTNSQIRVFLMEYHLIYGKYPDALIIDYVDIMGVEDKRLTGNKFNTDEEKTHDLRDICNEFDLYGFTACQLNREAVNVTNINYGHVAGGLSKVNGCDWMLAMYQTEEDIDNEIVNFKQLKVRSAEKYTGSRQLYKCPKTLRFYEDMNQLKTFNSPLTPAQGNGKVNKKLKNALEQ